MKYPRLIASRTMKVTRLRPPLSRSVVTPQARCRWRFETETSAIISSGSSTICS